MTLSLEHPELLLLIIPVIIGGFYLLRNTKTKLVEWRMLVAVLLVIALASPFTVATKTVTEENPSIVVVSDETNSMDIFEDGSGSRLYESLVANTPTSFVQLTGDKTTLGDSVLQYAGGDQQIVLVTDGNNNHGKSLVDALEFAKETGTPVYAVQPALEKNDLSVEVRGDKTLVVENENEFEIIVSQAGEESVGYLLEAYVDDVLVRSRRYSMNEREKSIIFRPDPFKTLGTHSMRVKITPAGEDWNAINNEFYKGLYVVPKPKLTLITDESNSPLAQVLSELYDVTTRKEFPGIKEIEDSKVLVLDNLYIDTLSESDVKNIIKFVSDGQGLIVVGGDRSYDRPLSRNYRNSSFEAVLPVVSKPSEMRGENFVVLVLDLSGSTFRGGPEKVVIDGVGTAPLYPIIIDSAKNTLTSDALESSKVGIIVIGDFVGNVSEGMRVVNPATIGTFENELSSLIPTNQLSKTDIKKAILDAKEMLDEEAPSESPKYIIIISDGIDAEDPKKYGYYTSDLVDTAKEVREDNVNFIYIDIESTYDSENGVKVLKSFVNEVEGEYIGPVTAVSGVKRIKSLESDIPDEKEEVPLPDSFYLFTYSPDHFITRNVNLMGNITGYNDVTPKAGAERLIITFTGKPVLTTWRYGLGRVAALTTDNGEGKGGRWGPVLYNESNAKLISSMANWAIGNPQAEEGAVLDGPDTWLGTPVDLTLTIYDDTKPKLKLDGKTSLDLSLTGRNTYETTVSPDTMEIHDISGYPLAVNYPLEFRDVGINKDIEPLIVATGGKIYDEREARALLLKDARENSEREVQEPQSLKIYFILAALLLFLGEVMGRRIREIKRLKKAQAVQEAIKEAAEAGE